VARRAAACPSRRNGPPSRSRFPRPIVGSRPMISPFPLRNRASPRRMGGALAAAIAVALAAAPLRAQVGDIDPPRAPAPAARGDSVPPIETCVGAFLAARAWTDAFELPAVGDPEARVAMPGVRGVSVILRHEGRVVGFGEEFADDTATARPDDLMLRRALGRAFARVRGDRAVQALPADIRDRIGPRLALELDFAGDPVPLLGRTFAECGSRVEPGLDGLALRRGASFHASFPSRLLATGIAGTPARNLLQLAGEAGYPNQDLAEITRLEPVGVYRFRSLRLAQPDPQSLPNEAFRAGRTIEVRELDRGRARGLLEAALARIARTMAGAAGADPSAALAPGLLGDYLPVPDDYRPLAAGPLERALLAFALAECATLETLRPEVRDEAARGATALLATLDRARAAGKDDPLATHNVAPLASLAASTLGRVPETAAEAVRAAREATLAPDTAGDPALRAAATAALAAAGEATWDLAIERLDAAWAAAPGERQVGAFPWLVYGESLLARGTGRPPRRAAEFRALAALILAAQVASDDPTLSADLAGGIRLGSGRPIVTAISTRPALGLAWLLARAAPLGFAANGEERERLVAGALATGRFLAQLAVGPDEARLFRNPVRVAGGFRSAAWESEQPVAVQAFGILYLGALLAPDGALAPAPSGIAPNGDETGSGIASGPKN